MARFVAGAANRKPVHTEQHPQTFMMQRIHFVRYVLEISSLALAERLIRGADAEQSCWPADRCEHLVKIKDQSEERFGITSRQNLTLNCLQLDRDRFQKRRGKSHLEFGAAYYYADETSTNANSSNVQTPLRRSSWTPPDRGVARKFESDESHNFHSTQIEAAARTYR